MTTDNLIQIADEVLRAVHEQGELSKIQVMET